MQHRIKIWSNFKALYVSKGQAALLCFYFDYKSSLRVSRLIAYLYRTAPMEQIQFLIKCCPWLSALRWWITHTKIIRKLTMTPISTKGMIAEHTVSASWYVNEPRHWYRNSSIKIRFP